MTNKDEIKQRKPLRNVIDREALANVSPKPGEYDMIVPRWKLECGHLVSPPSDIYGKRFPRRMRCEECATVNHKEQSKK